MRAPVRLGHVREVLLGGVVEVAAVEEEVVEAVAVVEVVAERGLITLRVGEPARVKL